MRSLKRLMTFLFVLVGLTASAEAQLTVDSESQSDGQFNEYLPTFALKRIVGKHGIELENRGRNFECDTLGIVIRATGHYLDIDNLLIKLNLDSADASTEHFRMICADVVEFVQSNSSVRLLQVLADSTSFKTTWPLNEKRHRPTLSMATAEHISPNIWIFWLQEDIDRPRERKPPEGTTTRSESSSKRDDFIVSYDSVRITHIPRDDYVPPNREDAVTRFENYRARRTSIDVRSRRLVSLKDLELLIERNGLTYEARRVESESDTMYKVFAHNGNVFLQALIDEDSVNNVTLNFTVDGEPFVSPLFKKICADLATLVDVSILNRLKNLDKDLVQHEEVWYTAQNHKCSLSVQKNRLNDVRKTYLAIWSTYRR